MTNCAQFRRWLDEGRPALDEARALAHASTCASCRSLRTTDDEIDRLLALGPPSAPEGFTDRLMARLAEPRAIRVPIPSLVTVPWWLRAALDPAAVLALVVGALLVWRGEALWAGASLLEAGARGWLVGTGQSSALTQALPGLRFLEHPETWLGLEIGLGCVLLVVFPALYRAIRRAVSRAATFPGFLRPRG